MEHDGRELAILDRVSYLLGSSRDLDEQFAQIMRFLAEQTSIRGAALVLRDNAISDSPNDGLSIVAASETATPSTAEIASPRPLGAPSSPAM